MGQGQHQGPRLSSGAALLAASQVDFAPAAEFLSGFPLDIGIQT
jgi:hypothetical protein